MTTTKDAGASGAPRDNETPDDELDGAINSPDADDEDDDRGEFGGDDETLTIEELALEQGWKPKDKWKGNPAEHISAAEFMRRLGSSQRALKKTVRQQDAEFADRIARLERANTAARQKELSDIKAYYDGLLEQAIESGDKTKIRAARDERDEALDELEAAAKAGTVKPPTDEEFVERFEPAHPTVMKPFVVANAWLLDEDDEEACEAFAEVEETIQQEIDDIARAKRHDFRKGPYAPTRAEMERAVSAAERLLQRAYRHRLASQEEDEDMDEEDRGDGRRRNGQFSKPAPREKAAERGGQRGRVPVLSSGNRRPGKSLASRLPPEAKAAAAKFVKQGLYSDDEEYARVYFREQGEKVD